MGVTVKNVYSDVDYHLFAHLLADLAIRVYSTYHSGTLGMGLPFSVRCVTWPQYRTRKFLTPRETRKRKSILQPSDNLLYYFRLTFRHCTTILQTISCQSNIKPPNIKPPTVLTIPTFLSRPPHCYFHSVSFYLCFPFFLTLCLTLFLPPTLCEISTNLCRISINLFLLRLAMSRFLLFLDIAEPTKKTH